MLKEYIIKLVFCTNNGIVICKTRYFFIMMYKVADIINTNVVLGISMPFLQNLKLSIIIFECNGFMQCRSMFIHIN